MIGVDDGDVGDDGDVDDVDDDSPVKDVLDRGMRSLSTDTSLKKSRNGLIYYLLAV